MFYLGAVLMMLCVALFGIACLQRRPLPRWNGLPLLAGLGLPLITLFSMGLAPVPELPNAVFTLVFAVSFVSLAVLGYLLQSGPQPAHTPASI
jgi:hypothetical protein